MLTLGCFYMRAFLIFLPSLPPSLPRHPAESVEPHLRRVGHPHLHPVPALRPQPRLARQQRGLAPLSGTCGTPVYPSLPPSFLPSLPPPPSFTLLLE